MSVPATVINATAPVRTKVRRLAIGVIGIPFGAGLEPLDPIDPFSLDDMSCIDQCLSKYCSILRAPGEYAVWLCHLLQGSFRDCQACSLRGFLGLPACSNHAIFTCTPCQ